MSESSNENNSVQSIKKRFELQILKNSSQHDSPITKISPLSKFNRSVSAGSVPKANEELNSFRSDFNKTSIQNTFEGSVAIDSHGSNNKDCEANPTDISTISGDNINFVFNRPQIDSRRKSQIKRKPAFRCGSDNKYTDKAADKAVNNQSFLFKHIESRNTNTSVTNSDNVNAIDKNSSKTDARNRKAPSVLFALMKKPSPEVIKKDSSDNVLVQDKTPDVNHMLKRLESILKENSPNVKPTPFSFSNVKTSPELSKNLTNTPEKSLIVKQRLINDKTPDIRDENAAKTIKDNVYHYIQKPDILNHLRDSTIAQNNIEYAICQKKPERERLPEPLYAEPFVFSKKIEKSPSTKEKFVCDSFESKRRRSRENEKFLEISEESEDLVDGVDKRNSAYAVSDVNVKPDLHYLCTNIYDIPSEQGLPEIIDFNVIKRECDLKNTISKKPFCKSQSQVSPRERRKHLRLSLDIVKNNPNSKETQDYGSVNKMEEQNKMADSGMSSMEASPDLEDIDMASNSATPSRILTEKRKHYVTRISSIAEYDWTKKLSDKRNLNSCYTTLRKLSQTIKDKHKNEKLFDVCLLVGYNSLKQGYIKSTYPPESTAPEHIEHLIFPQKYFSSALRCTKSKSMHNISHENNYRLQNSSSSYNFRSKINKISVQDEQNYSLVLTNQHGIRKFGYCRKILPENSEIYLPLVYCIVTDTRAPGFYFKVLQELESRHGQTDYQQKVMLKQLYDSKPPRPGQYLYIKIPNTQRPKSGIILNHNENHENKEKPDRYSFHSLNNIVTAVKEPSNLNENSDESNNLDFVDFSDDFEKFSMINRSLLNGCNKNCTEIVIKRPYDFRLENNELSVLFECLNVETIINVFGSLLIERKVVLVGESLSKLCSCIEGLQSSLYPFSWQHTLVTVLPHNLVEITNAPIPILAGILCTDERINVDEGILVNMDTSATLSNVGDEHTLIPSSLREQLKLSLLLVRNTTSNSDPTRNVLVSEAFLKFFVSCMTGYTSGFVDGVFDKTLFINSHQNKSTRHFLEWFVETTMFNHFVRCKTKILKISEEKSDDIESTMESDEYIDLCGESESFSTETSKNSEGSSTKQNSFYEIFDARIVEQDKNFERNSTKSFLRNHKALNKKNRTIAEKFKDFLHSS